ncbi:hypothetical protein [Deinococcus cellulosilyticus]|nr:hypothetical protein [Deinococcus cellulosilyticus]
MDPSQGQHELSTLLFREYLSTQHRKDALMLYGEHLLGMLPFDHFELKNAMNEATGVVYLLPYSMYPGSRVLHAPALLPEYSFFTHIVLCDAIEPQSIEKQIWTYLHHLSQQEPERFQELLQLHDTGLKTLALENEDLFRLLVHHFVFETTQGNLTLEEYLRHTGYVRFIPHADQYAQIHRIAASQGQFIIQASYSRDAELLTAYARLYPDSSVELMDAVGYASHLEKIEHPSLEPFQEMAQQVLEHFQVQVDFRRFRPETVPALLVASEVYKHHRHFQKTQTHQSALWTDVIEQLIEQDQTPMARLYLNFDSPVVQQLLQLQDIAVVEETLKMIFLDALLLGKHPITPEELSLLSEGLGKLMQWGMQASRYRNLN